ncbi:hypothetical protein Bca52824_085797 [Brassica carinata]|uniref:RNA-dependent RNA polymerase n=1 Tax=Brassica carinata TaxID=52824 RepID=A0A8X7P546_BRACI|nr:hypothetical protein Bca52824_085797 [Brassica carinata]
MGKTVNVSGFPPEVNAMEVRQLFESITGSGTIHAIRLKKTKHGEKFYALVQFAQETHANKLLTQSTKVNTPYRLNFHEWKYEIDSKDKASMEHYIDGLLMHFGFWRHQKFKYLYSVGCSFGSGNQNLHFSAHLSEDYIGRISWHLSQEKDSKLLLIQLKGGPKIYENQNQHVDPEYEKLNFCRGGFDNFRFYINFSNRKTKVYDRIYSVLSDGVVIGKKNFEFLAYSASQLKSTSTWMFSPIDGIKAADIRSWMGDFGSIKNVAKYAARLGQSFGSSKETLTVKADDVELIPDVEIFSSGKRYVFSDGIGKISSDFAELVARKCDIEGVSPSVFQIRYGGDSVFEKKHKEVVDTLDFVLTDPMKILCLMPPREHTKFLKDLVSCGIKPSEPFLSMMLHYIRESKLVELRTKTRILIPKGRSMMGCMDETNTLEYGQVFVRCSYSTNLSLMSESSPTQDPTLTLDCTPPYNIIGDVVVAKSPCLHPGDVRVLKAIAVTDLNHMTDCIVFPQKGHRPHPNECSGSDLDGDLYFVSWDPELIPPNTYEPMDYTAEEPQALDHEVTIQEITKHFTNYPLNNNVGTISNLHKVFADKEGEKAGSKQCLELAKMFSAAVDFPKTGVEVKIPPHLYVKEYPDFMENQNKLAYKSKTVIGKLFRELKKLGPPSISSTSSTPLSHDKDLVFMGFQNHIELATDYKKSYDSKLRH